MLSLRQSQGEQIRKTSGDVGGGAVELSEMYGCEVLLLDAADFVEAESMADTRIVVGACRGSLTVRNCSGCTIAACSAEVIVKDCTDCTFYLYVRSGLGALGRGVDGEVCISVRPSIGFARFPRFAPQVSRFLTYSQ